MNNVYQEAHTILPPNNLIISQLLLQAQKTIFVSRQAIPNLAFCNNIIMAKNRGVKIKILLSSPLYFSKLSVSEIRERFNNLAEEIILYTQATVPEKEKWITILRNNAIDVRFINHKKYLLNHSKYMIIDSKLAYIGSAPNEVTNRLDIGLVTRHRKQISLLRQLFATDFYNKKYKLPRNCGDILIAPENMRNKLEKIISDAKYSIIMLFPIITDDNRIFNLLKHKIDSGVVIRAICTPEMFSLDNNMVDRNYLLKLIQIGVQLKFSYDPPIHCRVIVVDSERPNNHKAYISSGHLKAHCLDFNREVAVITSIPSAIYQISCLFRNLWNNSFNALEIF